MYDLVGTEEKPRQSPQNPVPLDLHKSSTNGDVAQMVERVLSMHEAQGSIPCFSTFLSFLFVSFVFESVSNASSTRNVLLLLYIQSSWHSGRKKDVFILVRMKKTK
jgi:hypothetical protein